MLPISTIVFIKHQRAYSKIDVQIMEVIDHIPTVSSGTSYRCRSLLLSLVQLIVAATDCSPMPSGLSRQFLLWKEQQQHHAIIEAATQYAHADPSMEND